MIVKPVRPPTTSVTPMMAVENERETGDPVREGEDADEKTVDDIEEIDDDVLCAVCEPEDDGEEVLPHRTLRHPKAPTQKERDDHQNLHWPYRSWCRACVFGRGKHSHHVRAKNEKELNGIPSISMDFIFLGYDNYPAKKNAILIVYDNETDAIWAYRTGRKRAPSWLVPAILQDLAEAGYSKSKLCFRSDQENVVKSIKDQIIAARQADSVPMESPAKESKCNGRMERAIQTLEGQVKTLMMDLQLKSGYKMHPRDLAYQYLIQWACTILTRYRLTACGKTPFQVLTGRQCNRPVAGFATPVLWKQSLKDHEKKKGETDWSTGLFMGVRWRTSEAIVATGDRIVMSRTIQRDADNPNVTEEMLKSIPESAIQAIYSKKDENEEQDEEEPDKTEQEDEDDVADIFGEFSDAEPTDDKTTAQDSGRQAELSAGDRDVQGTPQRAESDGDSSETGSWIDD